MLKVAIALEDATFTTTMMESEVDGAGAGAWSRRREPEGIAEVSIAEAMDTESTGMPSMVARA